MKLAGVIHAERRDSPRYACTARVLFALDGKVIEAATEDISLTGLKVRTRTPLAVGTTLMLYLSAPDDTVLHSIQAEVMWARSSGIEELLGVSFGELSSGARTAISALIESVDDAFIPEADPDDVLEVDDEPEQQRSVPAGFGEMSYEEQAAALRAAVAADHASFDKTQQEAENFRVEARHAKGRGDMSEAYRLLQEAVKLCPHHEESIEELAGLSYAMGEVAESARLFDRLLRLRQERGLQ